MYNILIVDDEYIVHLALKTLIDWDKYDLCIKYEATSGTQALKILDANNDIDIVFTDIRMPGMDGLQLIDKINMMDKKPVVVVLSAFDDYDLVRDAFKKGAKDYILKTNFGDEKSLTVITNVIKDIENKNDDVLLNENAEKQLIKENAIKDMLNYNKVDSFKEIYNKIDCRINNENILVCVLLVDDFKSVCEKYPGDEMKILIKAIKNTILQILNDKKVGELVCISANEYVIVASYDSAIGRLEVRNGINNLLLSISSYMKKYVNISLSIGVSEIQDAFESIRNLYLQASNNVKYRFTRGKGRILFPEMVSYDTLDKHTSLIGREQKFIKALEELNKDEIYSQIKSLINQGGNQSIEKIHQTYMELIFIIMNYINELGFDAEDIFGKDIDFYVKIFDFETRDEVDVWLNNIMEWIIDYLAKNHESKTYSLIDKAKEFVKANYAENLTLKVVSEYVGLSESHFSYQFSNKMGITFVDYLTQIRIEKAKHFIKNTNMKMYEICFAVGFTSTEHFSRVFKKMVGISPISYRNK